MVNLMPKLEARSMPMGPNEIRKIIPVMIGVSVETVQKPAAITQGEKPTLPTKMTANFLCE